MKNFFIKITFLQILAKYTQKMYNEENNKIAEYMGACIQAERKVRPLTGNLIWIMPT